MTKPERTLEWKQKADGSLRGILDDVNCWDLTPYPPLSDQQLDRIDVMLTATITDGPDRTVVGVVGIALVPMSRHQVEGYLSLVAVRPSHRHGGIGRTLMHEVAQSIGLGQTKTTERVSPCPVGMHRLRLHTMRGTRTAGSVSDLLDTVAWYSRLGFQVRRVIPKYYRFALDDDGVEMVLDLTSRKRDRLK